MVDVHDKRTRSRNMAAVRAKNTKPELLLRRELFRQGFRFRLHYGSLPGKPDIVLPMYRAVVQVHGCFWHGHNCALFQWPATREKFWRTKINQNMARDQRADEQLKTAGWRVLTVWECALRGSGARPPERVSAEAARWLRSKRVTGEIAGKLA
jgi:DNA mismatch endonuclease (patch repair protein)